MIGSYAAAFRIGRVLPTHRFPVGVPVPSARLRGYLQKKADYRPDISGEHSGTNLVRYLEERVRDAAQKPHALLRVSTIHQRYATQVVSRTFDERGICEIVRPANPADFARALQAYLDSEDVAYAFPNYILRPHAIPNDPAYLNGILWGLHKIGSSAAWPTRSSANDIIVAVTDTGIQPNHPDLAANMWVNPTVGIGYNDGTYGYNAVLKPRMVYIRSLGPSLANTPPYVQGPLNDTFMILVNSAGAVVATNDDWRGFDGVSTALEQRLSQRDSTIGQAPMDNGESAIVAFLQPGP